MEPMFDVKIDIFSTDITEPDRLGNIFNIYSPEAFILEPREDIYLDLKFKINTSTETIEPWINLLPSLKGMGLYLEDLD